jgi:hypothetical protein
MSFTTARQVALHLGINVSDALSTDNKKLHIKAVMIMWPRPGGHGIIFIMASGGRGEDGKDREVKKWIEGLGGEGLRWASMLDLLKIAFVGTQPQRCERKWEEPNRDQQQN